MAQLILYQGTPNTPIETYEIDEEENVLVDLDGDEPTNGYHGKLIHFITQCGWAYRGNRSAFIFDGELFYGTPSVDKPYIFEHPIHGIAVIYIDHQGKCVIGPAAHQLAENLIKAHDTIYNYEEDDE